MTPIWKFRIRASLGPLGASLGPLDGRRCENLQCNLGAIGPMLASLAAPSSFKGHHGSAHSLCSDYRPWFGTHMPVLLQPHTHTHTHTHTQHTTHTTTHARACTHTHAHRRAHKHAHTRARARIHTHSHTHTHTPLLAATHTAACTYALFHF
jgi:hypothetical protein